MTQTTSQTTSQTTTRTLLGAGLLLLLGTLPAQAQLAPASAAPAGPDLSAQGRGEVKVPADVAFLTLSVTTEAKREPTAAQDNAARTAALLRAIRGLGIAAHDVRTSDYQAQRQFDTAPAVPVLVGYEVTNTVRVTLRDVSQASRLLDLAAGAGATRITELTYGLADRQAAERAALTLAAADARGRAQAIAEAMHLTLGSLRSVSDSAGATMQDGNGASTFTYDAEVSVRAPTPITPQEITVTGEVSVDYNVAP